MIQKIDLGRYVVLYNYGGITVDTDMVQLKPIDETPNINTDKLIVSSSAFPLKYFGFINNALLIAKKNHYVVKDIIQTIISNNKTASDFLEKTVFIINTTGPVMFSKIIKNHSDSIIILDNKYYEPCISLDMLCSPGKDAIMDHQHDGSWQNPFIKFMYSILYILLYLIIFLIPVGILYGIIILLQKYHIIPYIFKQVRKKSGKRN
jgi:mannosyltransferase OCH1-like enzyme